jgi:hypothetical protein
MPSSMARAACWLAWNRESASRACFGSRMSCGCSVAGSWPRRSPSARFASGTRRFSRGLPSAVSAPASASAPVSASTAAPASAPVTSLGASVVDGFALPLPARSAGSVVPAPDRVAAGPASPGAPLRPVPVGRSGSEVRSGRLSPGSGAASPPGRYGRSASPLGLRGRSVPLGPSGRSASPPGRYGWSVSPPGRCGAVGGGAAGSAASAARPEAPVTGRSAAVGASFPPPAGPIGSGLHRRWTGGAGGAEWTGGAGGAEWTGGAGGAEWADGAGGAEWADGAGGADWAGGAGGGPDRGGAPAGGNSGENLSGGVPAD